MTVIDNVVKYVSRHPYSSASALTAASGLAYVIWDKNRLADAYHKRFDTIDGEQEAALESNYLSETGMPSQADVDEFAADTRTAYRNGAAKLQKTTNKMYEKFKRFSHKGGQAMLSSSKSAASKVKSTASEHPKATIIGASIALGAIAGYLFYKNTHRPPVVTQTAVDKSIKQLQDLKRSVVNFRRKYV